MSFDIVLVLPSVIGRLIYVLSCIIAENLRQMLYSEQFSKSKFIFSQLAFTYSESS